MLPHQTFVLGGARSGKSSFAEKLVMDRKKPRVYIATAQAFDDEMKLRISHHKLDRDGDWRTIETPLDLKDPLAEIEAHEIVLIDCATLWLSNHMMAEHDIADQTNQLIEALNTCAGDVVIVSNEVGQGIVPDNAMARRFRDEQGRLNQRLSAWADLAIFITAGLPIVLKGQMP